MSALDDARAVLSATAGLEPFAWDSTDARLLLAALVAECESERAQLGELLVRAVEAQDGGRWRLHIGPHDSSWSISLHSSAGPYVGSWSGATLPDALRALLAKVEGS